MNGSLGRFQNRIFNGHKFEFAQQETNEVVRSNSNVILTQQTCGHRSIRVAGSKPKQTKANAER